MCTHMIIYNQQQEQNTNHHTNPKGENIMTNTNEINNVLDDLKEYTELAEELDAQIEALKDKVKAYITENNVDEVVGANGEKATWRETISKRFDSTAFKKDFADVYAEYLKKTAYKRFTFNA